MSRPSSVPVWYNRESRAGAAGLPHGLQAALTDSPLDVFRRADLGRGAGIPKRFLWLLDFATLLVAFLLAHVVAPELQSVVAPGGLLREISPEWLRLPSNTDLGDFRPIVEVLWMFVVFAPSTLLAMQSLGGYRPIVEQSRTRVVVCSVLAPLAGLGAITLVLFALKYHRLSRLLVFSCVTFSAAGLLLHRAIIRGYKRRRLESGVYVQQVALIGPTPALEQVASYLGSHVPNTICRAAGYLQTSPSQPMPFANSDPRIIGAPPPLPLLGHVHELGDLLIHRPIHEVILILSDQSNEWLGSVVEVCDYFRVTLRIVPDALLSGAFRDLGAPGGTGWLQLPQIVLRPHYLDSDALFVKRCVDIIVSATLLLLLAPLFGLIALAIKLTTPRLPIFYPWRVIGYKGRPFTGYKFTTMVADADERKGSLSHLNEMTGPVFKIKEDPRVTPLGRILRKYSLNELPQLWSVLKGDMSLVGPRPASPHELSLYELWHKRKLAVQPGITCLWQVGGRNAISNFDDWVRMDLEYIDNWSLWLDFKILVRTAWAVLGGTGS